MSGFTHYHSQYLAHRITLVGVGDDAFAQSLSTARVDIKSAPSRRCSVRLAARDPRGAVLADEVGLGKTIEAGLVIAQRCRAKQESGTSPHRAGFAKEAVDAGTVQQNSTLPTTILEAKSHRERLKQGRRRPFEDRENNIVITSYEFAARKADELAITMGPRGVRRGPPPVKRVPATAARPERRRYGPPDGPLQNPAHGNTAADPLIWNRIVSVVDPLVFGDEGSFS